MTLNIVITIIIISYADGFARKVDDIIYILMWKPLEHLPWPFQILLPGQQPFIKRNCPHHNCYVTEEPLFFENILEFDVLLFDVLFVRSMDLPTVRSERQKYVLVGFEPAGMNVIPAHLNSFFNLTWTYKLDSDIVLPYIVVKNTNDEQIGPKKDMHWIDVKEMNDTGLYVRNKLQRKRIAAAWFATNCFSAPSGRLQFVWDLQKELAKYGQRIDVYGGCGNNTCAGDECYSLIETSYYFYLAFENSFSEDYVSEKILTGLEHFSVPIVYGTANYTRFMPDGIYLNARTLGPAKLAKEMVDIIYNRTKYYDFFKWREYYSFHHISENDYFNEICGLCDMLNNKTLMDKKSVRHTNVWWNEWYNGPPALTEGPMRLILDEEKSVLLITININGYEKKNEDVIYLLLWTGGYNAIEDMPFKIMPYGRAPFLNRNCTYDNCYFTDDSNYFGDLLQFDVLLFNVLYTKSHFALPQTRSDRQTYVLVGLEPAGLHKVNEKMSKFFNISWTYRLDSDVMFGYIVVKNEFDEIIGPKRDMHWIDIKDMNETSPYIKNKLQKKRIAAAWFASNCDAPNGRLDQVRALQKELEKYDQRVDIYGMCGDHWCPGDECFATIESTYYFYLAYENSFSEDYVSEKILTALEHYAVPIVFGGANYTRFMPDGIYLDARVLGPKKLAEVMIEIIYNRTRYYDFFRWHGYYSFHYTGENDFYYEICGLCEYFNNKTRMSQRKTIRTNLWWNEWYHGIPATSEGPWKLLFEEDKSKAPGVAQIIPNIYHYIFD